MKFRAERSEFADAITWALRSVGARATLPALSGVLLRLEGDELQLSSTDLELSGTLRLPVQVEQEGTALIPGRLLGDVVRTLPNAAVEAEVNGDVLQLTCGRASFALRLMPAEDFPALPQPAEDAAEATLKADVFATTVTQVGRAASTDEHRPALTGVHLASADGVLTAAATDSYRLAVRSVPWDAAVDAQALIPRRALDEGRRAAESLGADVHLLLEGSQATISLPDRRLTTRLLEGTFPEYQNLIPQTVERQLRVDRAALLETVKRVAVVGEANTSATPVTLQISADTVEVTAGSGEVGKAEEALPGQLDGEPLQIGFNPRYLADGLEVAGGEEVTLEFRDELKPAVLRPGAEPDEGGDFLYLLMPVRL